jgi:hypothetical protein
MTSVGQNDYAQIGLDWYDCYHRRGPFGLSNFDPVVGR